MEKRILQGLFGHVSWASTIKNMGLENVDVNGKDYIGGLVGDNNGYITNCYATGFVTGERYIGGLVGINRESVTDSYATGSVTGNISVGGLVGENYGSVTDSYYDKETSGQTDTGKGEGLTSAEIREKMIEAVRPKAVPEQWYEISCSKSASIQTQNHKSV